MYFLIYKTTNNINHKFYIGMHKTKNINDGYMGSGKLIQRAIKKYGVENFSREILYHCNDYTHMCQTEAKIITEDVTNNPLCYNIVKGGNGGFEYINNAGLGGFDGRNHTQQTKNILREKAPKIFPYTPSIEERQRAGRLGGIANKGKPKSQLHKDKISKTLIGLGRKGIYKLPYRFEWKIQHPSGTIETVYNLKDYCMAQQPTLNSHQIYFGSRGFKVISKLVLKTQEFVDLSKYNNK